MKVKVLFFLFITLIGFSQTRKTNEQYDYINNYYQYVYQANYEFLNNNYQKAYDLLKTAESNCPLLCQTGIYEPKLLAQSAYVIGKKKEALKYAEILMKDFGFTISFFESDSILEQFKTIRGWKKIEKKAQKYRKEYLANVDFDLRKELYQMKVDDQSVRTNGYDREKAKVVDSINQEKLLKIIKEYDFYPSYGMNEVGNYNVDEYDPDVSVLIMHITRDKADFWKPILLELIRRGKAPANLYGSLSDSVLRMNGMFDYGIYQNVGPEQINDYENLDKRRISVGLPTRAYQNFEYNYWQNMFKKYQQQSEN